MTAWLTTDEMQQLTERQIRSAQCRALVAMGIPFRTNAVGRPLVERAAVLTYADKPERARTRPDWSALDAT